MTGIIKGPAEPVYLVDSNGNVLSSTLVGLTRGLDVNVLEGVTIDSIIGYVDSNNSSTTPLKANESFVGTSTNVLSYAHISVFVYADVASAADGLSIEWSADGIHWDETDVFTLIGGVAKIFSFGPPTVYMRVRYTNGLVDQKAFRLQTIGKPVRLKPSSHRIQDSIVDEDDAELVKSILSGRNPSGIFVNFGATAQGNFKVSVEEVEISGFTSIPVYGAYPDTWITNNTYGAAQTNTPIKTAPGVDLSLDVTDIVLSTDTAMNILLVRNTTGPATVFGPIYMTDNDSFCASFTNPIVLPTNENLGVTSSAAGNHTICAHGYIL